MHRDSDDAFSDAEMRAILARAIELDGKRLDAIAGADLRAIASEVGISPESLGAAIQEAREADAGVPSADDAGSGGHDVAGREPRVRYLVTRGGGAIDRWSYWSGLLVVGVLTALLFRHDTRASLLGVLLPIGAWLVQGTYFWMLRRWAPVLRSEATLVAAGAVAGACAGNVLNVVLLAGSALRDGLELVPLTLGLANRILPTIVGGVVAGICVAPLVVGKRRE